MTSEFARLGILVLDTDGAGKAAPGVGAYLADCLRELGVAQVFDAVATDQAVSIIGDAHVDGVIVNCPNGDAVKTSRALRAAAALQPANPTVIMVAGPADHPSAQGAFDVGVREFLAKPVTKASLAAGLRRLAPAAAS